MSIPNRLHDRVDRLRGQGDLVQKSMAWKPRAWLRRFPKDSGHLQSHDYRALFEAIEAKSTDASTGDRPRIGRQLAAELAASDALHTENGQEAKKAVVTAFLASMIWGYGMVGYGPYRTQRVLTRNGTVHDEIVIDQLRGVADMVRSEGGVAAFEHIANIRRSNRSYLKYLGPAFGTKFIYFLSKASGIVTTPVMDSVVTGWLQRNAPGAGTFNLSWWDAESYTRYVALLQKWADELSQAEGRKFEADDIELLIFLDARGLSTTAPESEDVTPESMLDDLGTEADARGGEEDKVGALLVEALREWFALKPPTKD
ncbi:hypothetical protein [uncultured Brachybacterium sp.]|uniref:8-oxoguanine DNA glycosylase OGG fold protein n=1 Tax=uncultured Brachybacterium sp. TaxID=189680 RepID=UPI002632CFBE|nr:hypothetical protein [uncultured Brachybacterium sp.]